MKHIVFSDETAKLIIAEARNRGLSPNKFLTALLADFGKITPHTLLVRVLPTILLQAGINREIHDQELHSMAYILEGKWRTGLDIMESQLEYMELKR